MSAIASGLSDEQIRAVSIYFASLEPQVPPPSGQAGRQASAQPPPKPEQTHFGAAMHPKAVAGQEVVPGPKTTK
ncbi:MAG TPA: hypothetical protein VFY39_17055 [Gammaproteobacteria bacterium]|nr:hypothetical protein [Gammaproteobacteria bacterium]